MEEWDWSKWESLTPLQQWSILEKTYPIWWELSPEQLSDAWEDVIIGVIEGQTLGEKIDSLQHLIREKDGEYILEQITKLNI